jgi:hypothetical protein
MPQPKMMAAPVGRPDVENEILWGGDFRLQGGSPAIDKGYPNGLSTDRDGSARPRGATMDIGAYEFGN